MILVVEKMNEFKEVHVKSMNLMSCWEGLLLIVICKKGCFLPRKNHLLPRPLIDSPQHQEK